MHPRTTHAPARPAPLLVSGLAIGGLVLVAAAPPAVATPEQLEPRRTEVRQTEVRAPERNTPELRPTNGGRFEAAWFEPLESYALRLARSDVRQLQAALADAEVDGAYVGADGERVDADRLRTWLDGRGSPLADHADELVAAGIAHDVDPRLVVGIAVIESSAGKRLPPGSHNAWGWSGRGPQGLAAWPSWPEAIHEYTEGLARVYDTDNVDERMARKYVPPNWEKWLQIVHWVIGDI